ARFCAVVIGVASFGPGASGVIGSSRAQRTVGPTIAPERRRVNLLRYDGRVMAESTIGAGGNGARHPLEPLDAAEIRETAAVLRAGRRLGRGVKVIGVTLHEPTRQALRDFAAGRALDREAFAILLDAKTGETEEVVVSLTRGTIAASRRLIGVQPPIVIGE